MPNLVELMKLMSEHTSPECASSCRRPHTCCDSMYCGMAKDYTKEKYGIDLEETDHPTIPFMGPKGCTIAPHYRPLCTVHTCEINSMGFKKGDPKWTKEYFRLRSLIEEQIDV